MFVLKNKKVCGYRLFEWTFYFTRHKGTDFCCVNEPLICPEDGQIIKQCWGFQGGRWIHFKGKKSGILYKFAHLSKYYYGKGNWIPEGAVMALTGRTGAFCRGYHLHFEAYLNNKTLNPETFNFNWKKTMKIVDAKKLHQVYNELLLRIADPQSSGYLGMEENEVRRILGGSEERQLLIRLVEVARRIKANPNGEVENKDEVKQLVYLATKIN